MKVSERSWHLRFVRFTRLHLLEQWYEPRDLCSYFWGGIVGSLLLWAFVLLLAAGVTCLVLGFIAAPFILAFLALAHGDAGPGVALLLALTVCALAIWERHRRPARRAMPTHPNPLIEYLRAKKRRVCPLIEVVPE